MVDIVIVVFAWACGFEDVMLRMMRMMALR
jgi:hypothetical protein